MSGWATGVPASLPAADTRAGGADMPCALPAALLARLLLGMPGAMAATAGGGPTVAASWLAGGGEGASCRPKASAAASRAWPSSRSAAAAVWRTREGRPVLTKKVYPSGKAGGVTNVQVHRQHPPRTAANQPRTATFPPIYTPCLHAPYALRYWASTMRVEKSRCRSCSCCMYVWLTTAKCKRALQTSFQEVLASLPEQGPLIMENTATSAAFALEATACCSSLALPCSLASLCCSLRIKKENARGRACTMALQRRMPMLRAYLGPHACQQSTDVPQSPAPLDSLLQSALLLGVPTPP